jgi:hypothetical protein
MSEQFAWLADKTMADKAFDIAFRGDTDGIDDAMAQLFRDHRLAAEARIVEQIKAAYITGATDVHKHWTANPGEAPRGDPEFGEAASDYAADAIASDKEIS